MQPKPTIALGPRRAMPCLVLASASPRRADLLTQAGLAFDVRVSGVDETVMPGEGAVDHARRVARAKASAVAAQRDLPPSAVVLAADTVVWLPPEGPSLGKPADRSHAETLIRMLTSVGANPHFVTTAWAIAHPDGTAEVHDETTRVWMRPIDADELAGYLATNEWHDKAGGYGIQGRAGAFVTRIEGSYSNVVGLPLAQVVSRLRALACRGEETCR